MFIIITLLCFYFIFLIFYKGLNRLTGLPCWRSSLLSASLVWGVLLTTITEFLSLFSLLTFGWVLGLWLLATFISAFIYFRLIKKRKRIVHLNRLAKIPPFLIFLIYCVVFLISIIAVTALMSPPNTGDSMAYHMSRVFHWIQNHNVAHYPTYEMRQLVFTPGAEFVLMHFQILSGGDYFASLVQWFCMVGSIIGVSLIAKQLGAGMRGQVFSAAVCVAIPMGILQGATTQNDYVASFWLVCFVYYILLTFKEGINSSLLLKVGASLGLALLTKGTAYIYAFPFLVCFVFLGLKRLRWGLWKPVLIIVIIVLFINLGYYIRNFDLYGRFPVLPQRETLCTKRVTVPLFISNVLRNISLHLGTPLKSVNYATYEVIKLIHKTLNISINDHRITIPERKFYIRKPSRGSEDHEGNFVHFILIMISIIIFLTTRQRRKQRDLIYYSAALTGAFLIFCFFTKWNPWNSRYHLPLFVLFCPFTAIVLSRIPNRKTANSIVIFIILLALPYVLYSEPRPLIGRRNIFKTSRTDQYFGHRESLKDHYLGAVHFLKPKGCSDIGLILAHHPWEYPFVVLLQESNTPLLRIEHVNVDNISSAKYNIYPFNDFNPCAIVSIKRRKREKVVNKNVIVVNKNVIYVKEWSSGLINVFIRHRQ